MQNIKLVGYRKVSSQSIASDVEVFTVDSLNKLIYGVTKTNQLVSIDFNNGQITECFNLATIDKVGGSLVISIQFLMESEVLNIYFSNGIIIGYTVSTGDVNCLAHVNDGIAAVSSSPDQDYIALITCQDKLFLFTNSLDVLVEKDLHAKHSECIEKVDIGWGSKQTQFHGSEGKQAAKVTGEPLEPPVPWDDNRKRIFWRGDGLYFVTSAIHPEKNHRVLRVWNNEGLLQYESEYVAGLEHPLAWRPEGNLIASSRYFKDKHEIVFFEKNGLRHREFLLPIQTSSFIIKHLEWSLDSRLLLIHGNDATRDQEIIYLYTMRNYHWYLKQTYCLPQKITYVTWDPSSPHIFYAATSSRTMLQYSFAWTIESFQDLVGVIDGCRLDMTPFKLVNLPPPMSAYSLVFHEPLNSIHLCDQSNFIIETCSHKLLSITTSLNNPDDSIERVKIEISVRNSVNKPAFVEVNYELNQDNGPIYHLKAINKYELIGIIHKENNFELLLVSLQSKAIRHLCSINQEILTLDHHDGMKLIALELSDGSIKKFSLADQELSDWNFPSGAPAKFPKKCESIKICRINQNIHLIGLTAGGTLYFDDRTLMANLCSSYTIHQEKYLVTTGNDNLLRCYRLDTEFLKWLPFEGPDPRDEPRYIERGAKIVTSSVEDARVILQMPRGNTESIHPRTLLLDLLKELLDNHKFGQAFKIMRRHRINLNLLVDHNWKNFLENVDQIIGEIGHDDIQDICLFLSELQEYHVTETMYKFAYHGWEENSTVNKLDLVCQQMRHVMESRDPDFYLIPILVTFVKEKIPRIDEALRLIHSQNNPARKDDAMKYLFYLIDVESLYKEALGTYDFDIVLMVAEKSNKDPKEYHQYLNELKSISDINYRRYKIDVDLKRYEKALESMRNLTEDHYMTECIKFIQDNRLYWAAVKIFPQNHPWMNTIWEKYADYLFSKRYYQEAGIAYENVKATQSAIKSYQLSGNWNMALALASSLQDFNLESLCLSLASNLKLSAKFSEAAFIQEKYLNDLTGAITTLIEGHLWDQAYRMLTNAWDEKLVDLFKQELTKHCENLLNTLSDHQIKLTQHVNRLKIVEEKVKFSLNTDDQLLNEETDSISDTSSISDSTSSRGGGEGSLATRKTRHKKKKNLKKYILKEGSAYEDIALRVAIKDTIKLVDNMREEVSSLIKWLYYFDYIDQATKCQEKFSELLEYMEKSVKAIWPQDDCTENNLTDNQFTNTGLSSKSRTLNERYLKEPSVLVPPEIRNIEWKLMLL